MQQFKNAPLSQFVPQNDNYRTASLKIDVSKPFQHKQIDTRWIQLKLNGKITPRSYFASCIQAGKVFIHGGYNEEKGILDDFVEAQFYDLPSEWAQIKVRSQKPKNPPPLRNHTICAYTSNLIIFGGQKNMLSNNNTFYKFDLRTNQWQPLKTKFDKDQKLKIALDSHCAHIWNNNMYIYGGYQSEKGVYSGVVYEVELKGLANNEVLVKELEVKGSKEPKARGNFGSCLVDNDLYIYGGTNSDVIFQDMWCLNLESLTWTQIPKTTSKDTQWPDKRKGLTMVCRQKSKTIFMFGGIREITKEQNDIMIFNIQKGKWVKIHKNTNELYEPSPTIKKQVEESPSIIDAKNRKEEKNRDEKIKEPFRLGVRSVTQYTKMHTQSHDSSGKNGRALQTEYATGFGARNSQSKRQMSVVQQKKHRQFLNRKKKLLSEVNKVTLQDSSKKRAHSPTSQTIIYSIDTIGQQKRSTQNFEQDLPKVIFDEQKGAVIGKKPCARDGHAALPHDGNIIIIGGDRHMMSFSDVYLFKMDKAMESVHLYE